MFSAIMSSHPCAALLKNSGLSTSIEIPVARATSGVRDSGICPFLTQRCTACGLIPSKPASLLCEPPTAGAESAALMPVILFMCNPLCCDATILQPTVYNCNHKLQQHNQSPHNEKTTQVGGCLIPWILSQYPTNTAIPTFLSCLSGSERYFACQYYPD